MNAWTAALEKTLHAMPETERDALRDALTDADGKAPEAQALLRMFENIWADSSEMPPSTAKRNTVTSADL